jgi:tetratricopeptide (TPR) repeat protein
LYEFAEALQNLIEGDYPAAASGFSQIIEDNMFPAKYVYEAASNSALLAGDLETAKKYALARSPTLGGDSAARVHRAATGDAVKLAYIYQREGREGQASLLLTETLDVIREVPRLGTYGFGIRDVQAYALLGRREDAIAAFREALDAGFRGSVFFDGWPIEVDPYLDSIRNDPRFVDMLEELHDYLVAMRDRVTEAEAAGRLDELRATAETI